MKLSRKLLAVLLCTLLLVPTLAMPATYAAHAGFGEPFTNVGDVVATHMTESNPVGIDGNSSEWDDLFTTITDENISAFQSSNIIPYYIDGNYKIAFKYDAERLCVAVKIIDNDYQPSTAVDEKHGGNGDTIGLNFDLRQYMRYDKGNNVTTRYWIYSTENTDGSLNFCMYRQSERGDANHMYGQAAGSTYYVPDPNGVVGSLSDEINPTTYKDRAKNEQGQTYKDENGKWVTYDTGIVNKEGRLDPTEVIDGAIVQDGNEIFVEFSMPWDMIIDDYGKEVWYAFNFDDDFGIVYPQKLNSTVYDDNGEVVYIIDPETGDYFLNYNNKKVKYQGWGQPYDKETLEPIDVNYDAVLLANGETRIVDGEEVAVKHGVCLCYWDEAKETNFMTENSAYYGASGTNPNGNCGIFLNMDLPTHEEDPDNDLSLHIAGTPEIITEPTFDTEGEEAVFCVICGKELDRYATDKLHKYTADEKLDETLYTHIGNASLTAPFTFIDIPQGDDSVVLNGTDIVFNTGSDTSGGAGDWFAQSGFTTKGEFSYEEANVTFEMDDDFYFYGGPENNKINGAVSFAWVTGLKDVEAADSLYIENASQLVELSEFELRAGRDESQTTAAYHQANRQSPLWEPETGNNYAGSTYLTGGITRNLVSSRGAGVIVNLYPSRDLATGGTTSIASVYEIAFVRYGNYRTEPAARGTLEQPIDLTKETRIALVADGEGGLTVEIKNTGEGGAYNLIDNEFGDYLEFLEVPGFEGINGYGVISLAVGAGFAGNANMTVRSIAGRKASEAVAFKYVADIETAIAALPAADSDYDTVVEHEDEIMAVVTAIEDSQYGEWVSSEYAEKLAALIKTLEDGPVVAQFVDVTEDKWFYKEVMQAVKDGLFKGTSETTFEPNTTTSRAMIVAVLHRIAGNPAPESTDMPFTDVPAGRWFTEDIAWAYENEIVNGTSATTFSPNDAITREQIAAMIYRFAEKMGIDVDDLADITTFDDASSVSAWAYDAMAWANGAGLIKGSANKLNPKGQASRAEAAAITVRFYETYVNVK